MTEPFEFRVPATTAHLGPGFGVLGLALDLVMRVRVEPRKRGEQIAVERRGQVAEPFDDPRHDPVVRGILGATARFELKLPAALQVTIESEIPLACGLGTTSGAYACGLAIAAHFARQKIPYEELLADLVDLGGDPGHGAAALAGGLVTCCQVKLAGGQPGFRVFPHALFDGWRFVVVSPTVQLGVADARRLLPASLPHGAVSRTAGRVIGLLRALALGDEDLLGQCIVDEVHVPFRRQTAPGMGAAMQAAVEAGAAGATVSGAGPSVIAVGTDPIKMEAAGAAMAEAFAKAGVGSRTALLRARTEGALDAG